jgi:peptidoglycan hydrolase-like protein with peptidoglycan-binding domain
MKALQSLLYKQGYLNSRELTYDQLVDGVWGETTLDAVKKYQKDHGLLYGQMTIETLEHIGVFSNASDSQDTGNLLGVIHIAIVQSEPEQTIGQSSLVESDQQKVQIESVAKDAPDNNSSKLDEQTDKKTVEKPSDTKQSTESENVTDELVDKEGKPATTVVIKKIIPKSRKPQLYKNLEGVNYMRCAANSLTPIYNTQGKWSYSKDRQELSATLCKRSRDVATMTDLQYELYEKGYLRDGDTPKDILVDGVWGKSTLEALKKYQSENGLLYGQLTIESLEYIGVFEPSKDRLATQNSSEQTKEVQSVKKKQANLNNKKLTPKPEIPFVPLAFKAANNQFDASTFVPKSSQPEVYGYVNNFKLWRCRARSVIPDNG